jgi:8-amino-7-oxononanoate synthase
VVAALARDLAARGEAAELVKVVETGVEPGAAGDAVRAAGGLAGVPARTLFSFRAALAPAAAAAEAGQTLPWADVLAAARALSPLSDIVQDDRGDDPDLVVQRVGGARTPGALAVFNADLADRFAWRVFEGAGGIASPLDAAGHDWADFGAELAVDLTIIVVPERLGAIHHARLAWMHATARGLNAVIWLNRIEPVPEAVSRSTRETLTGLGIPFGFDSEVLQLVARVVPNALSLPEASSEKPLHLDPVPEVRTNAPGGREPPACPVFAALSGRLAAALAERDRLHQRRHLRVTPPRSRRTLNLSDNDYLDLAHDPAVRLAAARAAALYGTSASASPLVSGWKEPHAALLESLCQWHGFPSGLLWTSGYAANSAVLGTLPEKGDLILADRLIHHSMIAGLSRSGARFKRYPHLDLDRLEAELAAAPDEGVVWIVTESVFSMDGDYPDLRRLAELKHRREFFLILDEAHALGWYGAAGEGLAAAQAASAAVDLLVGTLGKTLASGGAYTLFRDEAVRDTLINRAGELIYSTGIPPGAAAAAQAAVERIRMLAPQQPSWHAASRDFRARLTAAGWSTLAGDSPIVPVVLSAEAGALGLAAALRADDIWAAAVRPPTVPAGTSRLRFSLKRGFGPEAMERVLAAMQRWRALQ